MITDIMLNESTSEVIGDNVTSALNLSRPLVDDTSLPSWLTYPVSMVYITVTIVGFLGNAAILLALYTYPQFHRQTYYFLASTAAADILISLLLPLNVVSLLKNTWIAGSLLCHVQAYSAPVLFYASALSIMFTAMCRYLQVVHHTKLHLVKSKWFHIVLLLYIWFIGLVLFLPNMVDPQKKVVYLNQFRACRLDPKLHRLLLNIGKVLVEVPCPVLIIYFYSHIYIKHYKARRRIGIQPLELTTSSAAVTRTTGLSQGNSPAPPVLPSDTNNRRKLEARLTRSTLLISITFLLCWALPGVLTAVSYYHHYVISVNVLAAVICRSGPMFNFLINVSLNTNLREAMKITSCPCCCCTNPVGVNLPK